MVEQTAVADTRNTASHIADLQNFLRNYSPSYIEPARDTLDGKWRVELSTPLAEFDTKTARAYAAFDLTKPEKPFYALVCRPGTCQRHRIISTMKTINHPNILPLVAAGIVTLSSPQEERFVLFYERPSGKRLSQLLAETKTSLEESFIIKNIIAPLASAIHAMAERNITHGRINLDNIYYGNAPVIGDCISEPCGYSQPFVYEPVERIQSLPAAKGDGTSAQDFYALAVAALIIQHGPDHFNGLLPEQLIRNILHEGSYTTLLREKENSALLEEFFRGIFVHKAEDRWDYTYIKQWTEGKRFNVLTPSIAMEAIRPFELGTLQATTKRELAHLLYMNWSSIPDLLANGQLHQWIHVSLRNKELGENITRIANSAKDVAKNPVQFSEQLMRVMLLFDPAGPVRISPLSMFPDGMDSLCVELINQKATNELQLLAKFIEFNMINYWSDIERKNATSVVTPSVNNILTRLDRLRISIRNTGPGFGLERILYELNPEMPCMSPLFANQYITTLPALLKALDRVAPNLAASQDPLDPHIAAFIASKLNIQHEIRLHELMQIPELSANRSILALKLLANAQKRSTDLRFPGLAHWLGIRIMPALETLHSRTLRSKLIDMFKDRIATGDLGYVSDLVIDSNYATADRDGYIRASQTYRLHTSEIGSLRKNEGIEEKSAKLGYGIAQILASAAFVMTLLSVLKIAGG